MMQSTNNQTNRQRRYIGATLLALPFFFTGCLSVSLIGGRHQNVTFVGSDDNDASPSMQAPSQTSDMLKDMLKDLYPPTLPGMPNLPPISDGTPAPDDGGPATPPKPGPEPGVPHVLNGDFLWKPISDPDASGGGNLVILMDSGLTDHNLNVSLVDYNGTSETGLFSGVGNGNRKHFRFNKPGGAYASPLTVLVAVEDDGNYSYLIGDSAQKYDNQKPL